MTRYDEESNHALAGVPQEVLDAARAMMREVDGALVDPLDAEFVADAIVVALHVASYVTWPRPAVPRESVVLALQAARYEWESTPESELSLLEYLAERVVLPLLTDGRPSEASC